jgi:hypothetical protein
VRFFAGSRSCPPPLLVSPSQPRLLSQVGKGRQPIQGGWSQTLRGSVDPTARRERTRSPLINSRFLRRCACPSHPSDEAPPLSQTCRTGYTTAHQLSLAFLVFVTPSISTFARRPSPSPLLRRNNSLPDLQLLSVLPYGFLATLRCVDGGLPAVDGARCGSPPLSVASQAGTGGLQGFECSSHHRYVRERTGERPESITDGVLLTQRSASWFFPSSSPFGTPSKSEQHSSDHGITSLLPNSTLAGKLRATKTFTAMTPTTPLPKSRPILSSRNTTLCAAGLPWLPALPPSPSRWKACPPLLVPPASPKPRLSPPSNGPTSQSRRLYRRSLRSCRRRGD